MYHTHVQQGFYVTHKIRYYRGLCTTYMYNMDFMAHITHVTHKIYMYNMDCMSNITYVTHKIYLNKYKSLEYF